MLGAPSAHAQPASGCHELLTVARDRYVEQVYTAVEPLALTCVHQPSATQVEVQQAYRLLALSYIKQGFLAEARLAVARILGLDASYRADPAADLPIYVSLVDAVRGQLAATETPGRTPPEPPTSRSTVVDLNTAGPEALDSVPGIGPALAARIMDYREQNGPFRSVEDVIVIRGIGPRTLERMRPYLTVEGRDGEATPQPASDSASTPSVPVASVPDGGPVNLNTASTEELETLRGIGPALAARIIEFRSTYGLFQSVEEVALVRGIGPRTLEGFIDQVTVE